jgi:hypothetical protein
VGGALDFLRGPANLEDTIEARCEGAAKLRSIEIVSEAFEPLLEYQDDPVGFARDILGIELTEVQAEIAHSIRDNPQTSVAACYASGKTFLAAVLLLWWLYTRRPALIITTAPTKRQVEKLLWRYVRRLKKKAKRRLIGKPLTTQLVIDEDQLAFGFTGNSGHAVQGIHEAANVLFMIDEAAGMDDAILEDFEGATTGAGSRKVMFGNPTSDSGQFFNSHMDPKEAALWKPFSISAFDIINVIKKRVVIPGLVDFEWVERMRTKYGEGSIFWLTKVLGRFCKTAGEKIITPAWRDLAKERWATASAEGKRILGCDIGRTIDETVFVLREGNRARVVFRTQTDDLTKIADDIEAVAVELGVDRVNIDGTGLGIGVCDTIRRRIHDGVSLMPETVNVSYCVLGRGAQDKELFAGIIDEVFWKMREAFDPARGGALALNPEDEDLCEQVCWRGYGLKKGRFKVWTKKDTRKEYGSSPDDADALMLTFWEPEDAFLL